MSNILDIDQLVEPLTVLYHALDTDLFLNIISELNIDLDNGGSDEWLQEKINRSAIVTKVNAKTINEYTRLIVPAMDKLVKNINSTGKSTKSITSILNGFKRYSNSFVNYTNTSCLQATNKKYLEIVNTAY